MNQNKINLQDVPNIPIGTLSKLSAEQFISLQEQSISASTKAKMLRLAR